MTLTQSRVQSSPRDVQCGSDLGREQLDEVAVGIPKTDRLSELPVRRRSIDGTEHDLDIVFD
jgi:hypothetical protein